MASPSLILASTSPRRKQLLEQLGYAVNVRPVDIDETPGAGEPAIDYVLRMASEKCAVALKATEKSGPEHSIILAGDTIGLVDGEVLTKPENYEDFCRILNSLSGRKHTIITSYALAKSDSSERALLCVEHVKTDVYFKSLHQHEIDAYWLTGEPQDKAGGYGIQGFGAAFVEKIVGSYSNVVGLPLMEVHQALCKAGMRSPLNMEGRF